jgi:hypothetical protein
MSYYLNFINLNIKYNLQKYNRERYRTPPRGRFWRNARAYSGRKQKKKEKRKIMRVEQPRG